MDPHLTASPRREFQQASSRIADHRGMVKSEIFDRSSKYAMLQYAADLATSTAQNPNLGTVNGMKLAGAHEFLMTLKTLAEEPTRPVPANDGNLNHRA